MHLGVSAEGTGERAEDAEMLVLAAAEDQIGGAAAGVGGAIEADQQLASR